MNDESKRDAQERQSASKSSQGLTLELHQQSPELIEAVLFPNGTSFDHDDRDDLLDYYRLVLQNNDQISTRRQNLNSFFLSINSVIMAGVGVIVKEMFTLQHQHAVIGAGVFMLVLSIIGLIVCRSWGALIRSSARMLQANAVVAQELEKHMLASITTTLAKLHGTDFIRMAKIEESVAGAFVTIYCILVLAAPCAIYCIGGFMQHAHGGGHEVAGGHDAAGSHEAGHETP